MFADLGIIGGVTFGFMFLLVPIFTIKIWRKSEFKPYHLTATISFMAVTCYAVDAFLNFPAERTAMQSMLAISAALVFLPISHINKTKTTGGILNKKVPVIFYLISLLLLVPSIYVAKQTYDSLKIQKYVMGEIDADPKMALDEVKSSFPSIPNLSTSTLPIKGLIARYEFRDKHYDEALRLLNESENDNPYLHYNDFIRTAVYADKQKFDSVAIYAKGLFIIGQGLPAIIRILCLVLQKTRTVSKLKKHIRNTINTDLALKPMRNTCLPCMRLKEQQIII